MPPAPAERVRTILERAATVHLTWLGPAPGQPVASDTVGGVLLARQDALATRPVIVEVADPAPLPVPNRIRSRVRLHGHARPAEGGVPVRIVPASVRLQDLSGEHLVCPADVLAAAPDPLATCEGSLLGHLDSAHRSFLDAITGLVRAEHLGGVVRVWPLELDRCGIVLQLSYARGHKDVRLGFPGAAATAEEALHRLQALAVLGAGRHRCRARASAEED